MSARVSIVVPALDEERALPACLASVRAQEPPFDAVVVDGGSRDRTLDVALRAGARVIRAPRGRAAQMNEGARATDGQVLLFLHADTILPPRALRAVRRAVRDGADAGAFRLRYDDPGLAFQVAGWVSDLHCRRSGDLFGDRAIFVRRPVFEELEGFRPLPLMEDLDFASRLRARGRAVRVLGLAVTSSARRFRGAGIARGGLRAWRLVRDFHAGRPLDRRAAEFYGPRS